MPVLIHKTPIQSKLVKFGFFNLKESERMPAADTGGQGLTREESTSIKEEPGVIQDRATGLKRG